MNMLFRSGSKVSVLPFFIQIQWEIEVSLQAIGRQSVHELWAKYFIVPLPS